MQNWQRVDTKPLNIVTSVVPVMVMLFIVSLVMANCSGNHSKKTEISEVKVLDLSKYSSEKPSRRLNLLFIHHSCGATLLASPGEKKANIAGGVPIQTVEDSENSLKRTITVFMKQRMGRKSAKIRTLIIGTRNFVIKWR